jgi:hypothetical protein
VSGIPLWLLRDGKFESWYSDKWTGDMTPHIARTVPEDEAREAVIAAAREQKRVIDMLVIAARDMDSRGVTHALLCLGGVGFELGPYAALDRLDALDAS